MIEKLKHDLKGDLAAIKLAVNLIIDDSLNNQQKTNEIVVLRLILEKLERLDSNFGLILRELKNENSTI